MVTWAYKPRPTWTALIGGTNIDISEYAESWDFSHGADVDPEALRYIPRPAGGYLELWNGDGYFDPTSPNRIAAQDQFENTIPVTYTCGNVTWSGEAIAPAERHWNASSRTVWQLVDNDYTEHNAEVGLQGVGTTPTAALAGIVGNATRVSPDSTYPTGITLTAGLDVSGFRTELVAGLGWVTGSMPFMDNQGRLGLASLATQDGVTPAEAPANQFCDPRSRVRRVPAIGSKGLTNVTPLTTLEGTVTNFGTQTWVSSITDFIVFLPQDAISIEAWGASSSSGTVLSTTARFDPSGRFYRVRVVVDMQDTSTTVTINGRIRRRTGSRIDTIAIESPPDVTIALPPWINSRAAGHSYADIAHVVGLLSKPRVMCDFVIPLWAQASPAVTADQLTVGTKSNYRLSSILDMDCLTLNVRHQGRRDEVPYVFIQGQVLGASSFVHTGDEVEVTGPEVMIDGDVVDPMPTPEPDFESPGRVAQPTVTVNAARTVTIRWATPSGTVPFTYDVLRAPEDTDTVTVIADNTTVLVATDTPGAGTWRYRVVAANTDSAGLIFVGDPSEWATIEVGDPTTRTPAMSSGSVVLTGDNEDPQGVTWIRAFTASTRTPRTADGSVALTGDNADPQGVTWIQAFTAPQRTARNADDSVVLTGVNSDPQGVVWIQAFTTATRTPATSSGSVVLTGVNSDPQGVVWIQAFTSDPPTATINVSPPNWDLGERATLTWSSTNATTADLRFDPNGDNFQISTALSGTQTVTGPGTTGSYLYRLTVMGPGGTATASRLVTISAMPDPTVSFETGFLGTTIRLDWPATITMDSAHTPNTSDFAVTVSSGGQVTTITIGNLSWQSGGLALLPGQTIAAGANVAVAYTRPSVTSRRIQTTDGIYSPSFTVSHIV